MGISLKPLHHQVIFITGATSGIGLATARMAAQEGAKIFMVARDEDELQKIQDEFRQKEYASAFAVADVGEFQQLQSAAERCVNDFGRIDTFINNAGFSIYGRLLETNDKEARELFDTNFWGVVNGCKVAVPFLKQGGGALINIGSVLSEVALPIQGIYSASKYAVKAYTDALRRELIADESPISVTLVMPGAIDTPYTEHAKSKIGEPVHTPPVYDASVAAKAILECAVKPTREIGVGASSFLFPFMDRYFPKLQDIFMAKNFMEDGQRLSRSKKSDSSTEGQTEGNYPGHVMKSSVATRLSANSSFITAGAAVIAAGILVFRRLRLI